MTAVTRIGVAIAVPEPWGEQLRAFRREMGDTSAQGIPTHITLVPPCNLEPSRLQEVERHLDRAAKANEPFRIHLRGTGTFRPTSPVVFVAVVAGISACELLASAARSGPLASDPTFPYHPHVTVAHGLGEEELDRAFEQLATFACEFTVDRFALYVHDAATGWKATRLFRLGR
jgi:2'-5' RNA ligase